MILSKSFGKITMTTKTIYCGQCGEFSRFINRGKPIKMGLCRATAKTKFDDDKACKKKFKEV